MSRILIFTAILFALVLSLHDATAMVENPSILVDPDHVLVGLFYGGQKILVKTDIPQDYEAVISIRGAEEDLHLKKKGKVWGILWMNVGEVSYETVPSLYIVSSSRKIDAIAPANELLKWDIGYQALKEKCAREPEAKELFGDLIKLKGKDGLFEITDGKTRLEPPRNGVRKAIGEFVLPPKAPVGEYTIDVFAFKDGVGSRIGSKTFSVEPGPVISLITTMATNRGLVYGCVAVIIAIIAGLFTGFIFGIGQGKGH